MALGEYFKFAELVTPSDTVTIAGRAIYVGVGGDINLELADGSTRLFVAVPQGTILPVAHKKIMDDDTDASSLVSLS